MTERKGFRLHLQEMRYKPGGRTEASAPTDGYKGCGKAGDRKGRPYGKGINLPRKAAG